MADTERVARAICKAAGYNPDGERVCGHGKFGHLEWGYKSWQDFTEQADAAIKVMT